MKTFITPKNLNDFIGKTIFWTAPAAEGNADYQGVATIQDVNFDSERPIKAICVEGDDLNLACMGAWGEFIAYSDMDRPVTAELR